VDGAVDSETRLDVVDLEVKRFSDPISESVHAPEALEQGDAVGGPDKDGGTNVEGPTAQGKDMVALPKEDETSTKASGWMEEGVWVKNGVAFWGLGACTEDSGEVFANLDAAAKALGERRTKDEL